MAAEAIGRRARFRRSRSFAVGVSLGPLAGIVIVEGDCARAITIVWRTNRNEQETTLESADKSLS